MKITTLLRRCAAGEGALQVPVILSEAKDLPPLRERAQPQGAMTVAARSILAGIGLLALLLTDVSASAQRPAEWRLTPELRIGHDQDFTHILAVLPAADGSVAIADDRNGEIRVFNRDGVYTHSIGGAGQGPGEFVRLRSVGVLGDSVWVISGRPARTSFFARDGTFLGSIRNETGTWLTAMVPGGALGSVSAPLGMENMFRDEELPVLRLTRTGETVDTLAWVPGRNLNLFLGPRPDGSYTLGRQPFSDAGLTILAPNSSLIFLVDRTVTTTPDDASFRVTALRPDGDTLWSRSYPYVPSPNTRADSVWNAMLPRLSRYGHSREDIRSGVFIPEYYTPVSSGFASDGLLWLRREEGRASVDYWVLRDDGRLIASVTVPANVTLMAASDSEVWGVATDEFDVPTVIRYRIQR